MSENTFNQPQLPLPEPIEAPEPEAQQPTRLQRLRIFIRDLMRTHLDKST